MFEQQETLLVGRKWITIWCAGLVFIGTVSRFAPLADPSSRLLRQFMSEDGYIMQTVARNIAIGLGMTVSDGTVQTNGVQPLGTFLFSLFYLIVGGDKVGGVAGVQLFSVVVSIASAYVLYKLIKTILKNLPEGAMLAAIVASLWYASPLTVKNSMNGLETGLYFLISLLALQLFAKAVEYSPSQFTLGQMLILGLTFGVCFLVRNDAVFLIAAILGARFLLLWPRDLRALRWRIVEGAVPGVVSLLIALPWLFYNYRLFGSIVPISGVAESTHARFGQNLALVPTTIVELVTVIAPIPRALESSTLIIWLSVLLTGVAALLSAKLLWARSASGRFVLIAYLIFSILVIGFYGLFFGAGHFIPRFLGVLSPFLALLGVSAGYRLILMMQDHWRTITLKAGAALAMVAVLGANWIIYRNGHYHQHMQVVDWVEAHVPNETWVAAVQSGTLGFYHDRTINLDGKVNAEALRAAARDGGVTSYLLRSEAMYLADWYGMASWAKIEKDGFNSHFELIVADERANLAVLRRVHSR